LDPERCGSLDHRLPVFGARSYSPHGSLACDDNLIFSHISVAIVKTGEPAVNGSICCYGNMDYRPLHVDIQCEFLWRRSFSAGCLAVLCFRHTIISVIYVSNVRLRRHILRFAHYNIAASHPLEPPLQRSHTPVPVAEALLGSKSAELSWMVGFSDRGSHILMSVLHT